MKTWALMLLRSFFVLFTSPFSFTYFYFAGPIAGDKKNHFNSLNNSNQWKIEI